MDKDYIDEFLAGKYNAGIKLMSERGKFSEDEYLKIRLVQKIRSILGFENAASNITPLTQKILVELEDSFSDLKIPVQTYQTGRAEFPVINGGFAAIRTIEATRNIIDSPSNPDKPLINEGSAGKQLHEAKTELPGFIKTLLDQVIKFNCDGDSKVKFNKAYNTVLDYIQDNLRSCEDESIRDITLLKTGISLIIPESEPGRSLAGGKPPEAGNRMIKGGSFSFAAIAAFISELFDIPINPRYIYTGALSPEGKALKVNDLKRKTELIKSERNFDKIIIPSRQLFNHEDRLYIEENPEVFYEVSDFKELIKAVFNKELKDICALSDEKRHTLGLARIKAESLGRLELEFCTRHGELIKKELNTVILHFDPPRDVTFDIFPLRSLNFPEPDLAELVVFEGRNPNHYTGNFMRRNTQVNSYVGIKNGGNKEIIVFALPSRGADERLEGAYCNMSGYLKDYKERA